MNNEDIPGQLPHPIRHKERMKQAKLHAQAILPVDNTTANRLVDEIIGAYFNPQEAALARD